jgi:L-fucose dehydrogenase
MRRHFTNWIKNNIMDLGLKNKIIIVTGGARGIGEGIVRVLTAEGAVAVIIGRNASDNIKLQKEMENAGGRSFSIEAELSEPAACEKAVKAVTDQFGRVDGLVNNAGVNDGVGLENGDYHGFMKSLHNNLVHYYLMAHFSLPFLKESKGAIVNISSKTAETGQGNTSAYAAANGGRNALTREWAVELLKYNIRVNSVIVSECYTLQYESWLKTLKNPDEKIDEIISKIPFQNRMTTAAEIAQAVAFLLSEKSSHTTGQLLHVDGGYVHLDRALANA